MCPKNDTQSPLLPLLQDARTKSYSLLYHFRGSLKDLFINTNIVDIIGFIKDTQFCNAV